MSIEALSATEIGMGIIAAGYILDKTGSWFYKMSNGKNGKNEPYSKILEKQTYILGDLKDDMGCVKENSVVTRDKISSQHNKINEMETHFGEIKQKMEINTRSNDQVSEKLRTLTVIETKLDQIRSNYGR